MERISLFWPSWPDDAPRWLAALLAVAAVVGLPRILSARMHPATWLLAPLAAAALSAAYLVGYLGGAPRIIDATAYYLEARTFAAGAMTMPVMGPEASVLGRFLLRGPDGAAVIFPPGYPALLSLGFRLGIPLAIGPLLAALLTFATMDLARLMPLEPAMRGRAVALAALLSVICATLRHHTAETMSHGLSALCLTVAAGAALRARAGSLGVALSFGLAFGLLFATRPVSALAAVVLLPLLRGRGWWVLLGAGPGIALWLGYQAAATGAPWLVAQHEYYAMSDGPAGCFRYGFGAVGCLGEHGDFVRERMPDGFGLQTALATTARRLAMHLSDALGFAPAFLLVLAGMRCAWRARLGPLALVPPALVIAYAPFYFDGNYPGGGARLLSDVLPIEIVLAAFATVRFAPSRSGFGRAASIVVGLALAAFALHGGALHRHLREREGGAPMFRDPPVAGMLFLDTDHGFNLAFDPTLARSVARFRGDIIDTFAWRAHGAPPAFRYRFDPESGAAVLVPMEFSRDRLEGESLWPALAQRGGFAWPEWRSGECASGGRVLAIEPLEGEAEVTLGLPRELVGAILAPRLNMRLNSTFLGGAPPALLALEVDGRLVRRWVVGAEGGCRELEPKAVPEGRALSLRVVTRAPLSLDVLRLVITR